VTDCVIDVAVVVPDVEASGATCFVLSHIHQNWLISLVDAKLTTIVTAHDAGDSLYQMLYVVHRAEFATHQISFVIHEPPHVTDVGSAVLDSIHTKAIPFVTADTEASQFHVKE
jgi:hypothetical protein